MVNWQLMFLKFHGLWWLLSSYACKDLFSHLHVQQWLITSFGQAIYTCKSDRVSEAGLGTTIRCSQAKTQQWPVAAVGRWQSGLSNGWLRLVYPLLHFVSGWTDQCFTLSSTRDHVNAGLQPSVDTKQVTATLERQRCLRWVLDDLCLFYVIMVLMMVIMVKR